MLDYLRRNVRHPIDTSIVFTDVKGPNKYKHVKMYNFNENGIYFESDCELIPGTEIIIEVSNYFPGPSTLDGKDLFRAKVRWCNKVENSNSFAIGTEILGYHTSKKHEPQH
jgi:hypothetical protein